MKYLGRNIKEAKIIKKAISSNNDHIFKFWNELNDHEKDKLINEISTIKISKIKKMYNKNYLNRNKNTSSSTADIFPADSFNYSKSTTEKKDAIKQAGVNSLKKGEVAFLTVAGGQASRLGIDKPKGCYGISPIKIKSLFQIFAEKIKFYSGVYHNNFKWYIMTSESNYKDTLAFFDENNYFELNKNDIFFFKQSMLPTLTLDGKLILQDKNSLFLNPDGHGGILKALLKTGLIDRMLSDGIKYLSYFQVDNPLIMMADPYFIGYHIISGSDVSTKVIPKKTPEEKLGAIGRQNNVNKIIEYSDLSDELMYSKNENGEYNFSMGSIGVHIFSTAFIKKKTKKLPFHIANKKILAFDPDSTSKEKKEIDAIKFETFVFDVIPFSKNSVFFETERNTEFFPLKNKTGNDSIETCINGQIDLYKKWLSKAGIDISNVKKCEISPLFAADEEHFLDIFKQSSETIREKLFEKDGSIKNEIYIS